MSINKSIIFAIVPLLFLSITLQAQSSFKHNNSLHGPFLGFGFSFGKRPNLAVISEKLIPGSAVHIGYSLYFLPTTNQAIGGGIELSKNNWKSVSKPPSISNQNLEVFLIRETRISIPLEIVQYFSTYKNRWLASLNIAPGYLAQKTLYSKGIGSADSTNTSIFNETQDYKKINLGFGGKIGLESDLDYKNTIRSFIAFNFNSRNSTIYGKSSMMDIVLTFQYFWSK